MNNILIVDDHPLMANATKDLLIDIDQVGDIQIAHNVKQGIQKTEEFQPDLVIMDYYLNDATGTDAADEISSKHPNVKILFLTGLDLVPLLPRIFNTNAWGAISKEVSPQAIKNAVCCVLSGLMVFPRCNIEKVPSPNDVITDLSGEEVQIMKEVMNGATYAQIADIIHMSRRTVDNYMKRIFEKLGAKNKTEAVERFMRTKFYQGMK
ncbi:Transcriptional regulatory protein ComA [compost metagenome]